MNVDAWAALGTWVAAAVALGIAVTGNKREADIRQAEAQARRQAAAGGLLSALEMLWPSRENRETLGLDYLLAQADAALFGLEFAFSQSFVDRELVKIGVKVRRTLAAVYALKAAWSPSYQVALAPLLDWPAAEVEAARTYLSEVVGG